MNEHDEIVRRLTRSSFEEVEEEVRASVHNPNDPQRAKLIESLGWDFEEFVRESCERMPAGKDPSFDRVAYIMAEYERNYGKRT